MLRTAKPRNAASARALKKKEPKLIEDPKVTLFIKGSTTSELSCDALKDLYSLKRPNAILFSRKNDVHPFDDPRSTEFLSTKNDAALLLLANHSKKRPHNLTFIRTFDHQILDLVELGITRALPMAAFEGARRPTLGNRACVLIQGDRFETDENYKKVANVLLDFFRGETADMVNLKGLEHVVSISVDGKGLIHIRCYMTTLLNKEGGGKLPKVELEECGPALEMELRRTRFGDEDIYKEALRVPKVLEPKKVKNIEHDSMGDKTGRIHMEKQDLSKLQTRKIKGLKRLQKEVKKGDMKKGGDATGGGRAVKRTKDDREAPRAAKKRKQMQQ